MLYRARVLSSVDHPAQKFIYEGIASLRKDIKLVRLYVALLIRSGLRKRFDLFMPLHYLDTTSPSCCVHSSTTCTPPTSPRAPSPTRTSCPTIRYFTFRSILHMFDRK